MIVNKSLKAKNLGGPGSRRVECIVLHDTDGSGKVGDVHYLANDPEKRGVSVDFVITRDGVIWQLNPDLKNRWTFHAGRHTRFRNLINGGVNKGSIGIELAHKADAKLDLPLWPTAQVKACAELCQWLTTIFDVQADDITTHQKIITDGTRSDPREFPFPEFWAYFNGDVPEKKPVVIPVTGLPAAYTVIAGDTLWKLAQKFSTTVEGLKKLNNINTASNVINVGQVLRVK